MEDKVKKGRQYRGGHGLKLSPKDADSLCEEYTGRYGELTSLGKKYGIGRNTVREYIKRAIQREEVEFLNFPGRKEEDEIWESPISLNGPETGSLES